MAWMIGKLHLKIKNKKKSRSDNMTLMYVSMNNMKNLIQPKS